MRRLSALILFAGLALSACGTRPTPAGVAYAAAPPENHTPAPTWTLPFAPSAAPAITPAPTLAPVPTATPIILACTETRGSVEPLSVPSPTLRYAIDALIYLPPCYDSAYDFYPVLYLVHGLNFTQDQWSRLGAPAAADELIAAGEIAPLIIVMPRDRLDARLDPAFVNDLVPYIDQNYRTRPYREFRAIGGLSRGAGWAIHLGLHYPEVFGRIGAHSPAIFYGDENSVLQWARHLPADRHPAVYVDIGEGDSLARSASWLAQVLTWFQIEHAYIVRAGAHTEKYWSAHVAEYLRFYAADWRLAVPTPVPDTDF